MDRFLTEHLAADGRDNGPDTMGYYERSDLAFYYALADAFTICDRFFCSVIGPTDPNRLYSMSATIDPAGRNGGPQLETLVADRAERFGTFTWTTMPERLQAAGIDWKVYGDPDGNYGDNVLVYFKRFFGSDADPELFRRAFTPIFPADFEADARSGNLPQVSWVLAPLVNSEHPPAPVEYGQWVTHRVLDALTADPRSWAKTALIVAYDENGGFFDHVPPPVAPPGTQGEWLTVDPLPDAAEGIRGPIGLGFRIPALVVSPFSRGGFVCSDTFDLTSTLLLLESRFGVEVPNLSDWRRATVGDLTAAFNFVHPEDSVPSLPATSLADPRVLAGDCPTQAPGVADESFPTVQPYPIPPPSDNVRPSQEPGRAPAPSGPVGCRRETHDRERVRALRDAPASHHGGEGLRARSPRRSPRSEAARAVQQARSGRGRPAAPSGSSALAFTGAPIRSAAELAGGLIAFGAALLSLAREPRDG